MTSKLISCIITICILLTTFSLKADEKSLMRNSGEAPDFAAIKAATTDPANKYFYPKLFARFMSNDTLMNSDEYRHLYYGYVFQEDYDPYRMSEHSKRVDALYFTPKHTREECDTIIKYAELALADNPFDLRQMMFLIISLREKQKNARAAIWQYKLNHLVGAIMSSGNGTLEQPWHVISPMHEYNLLNFMNYVVTNHEDLENGTIDYLSVKKSDESDTSRSADGFYFNISELAKIFDTRYAPK